MSAPQFINGTIDTSNGTFYPFPIQIGAPDQRYNEPAQRGQRHVQPALRDERSTTMVQNVARPRAAPERNTVVRSDADKRKSFKKAERAAFIAMMDDILSIPRIANANTSEGEVCNLWRECNANEMKRFWHFVKEDETAISHWAEFDLTPPMGEVRSMLPEGMTLTLIDKPRDDEPGKIFRKLLLHDVGTEVY
jgi:hypothetical protein